MLARSGASRSCSLCLCQGSAAGGAIASGETPVTSRADTRAWLLPDEGRSISARHRSPAMNCGRVSDDASEAGVVEVSLSASACSQPASPNHIRRATSAPGRLHGRGFAVCARQSVVETAARADLELCEHFAQVPLDGPRADEKTAADLGVFESI